VELDPEVARSLGWGEGDEVRWALVFASSFIQGRIGMGCRVMEVLTDHRYDRLNWESSIVP
jgi:hypothetical protein